MNFTDGVWAVEYARGPLMLSMPFGLADELLSTLDFSTALQTLSMYTSPHRPPLGQPRELRLSPSRSDQEDRRPAHEPHRARGHEVAHAVSPYRNQHAASEAEGEACRACDGATGRSEAQRTPERAETYGSVAAPRRPAPRAR